MAIGPQVTIPPIPHGNLIEKLVAGRLVEAALAAGYSLSVDDGEEVTVKRSKDAKTIFEAMASTDMDRLLVHREGDPGRIGWILLIWGNGRDLISDYVDNVDMQGLVDPVNEWADKELA